MTDFQKEIDELQKRMAELERQKEEHEVKELQKKTSMEHNLDIISEIITIKTNAPRDGRGGPGCVGFETNEARDELVLRLEAIYNSLKILDNRLTKLEKSK